LAVDGEEVSRCRAEVIERAINVESIIDSVICQHYFGHLRREFLLEVLYDEHFSFALKRLILEKIVSLEPAVVGSINRLNTIRNYFAHCAQEIIEGPDPLSGEARVPDPRKPDRSVDFKALHAEFMSQVGDVEEQLGKVFRSLGGEMYTEAELSRSAGEEAP